MSGNMQITIISLNVNGMNSPIKRKQIAEWISNQKPTICCLQETHMRQVDTHRFKMKQWNNYLLGINQEKEGHKGGEKEGEPKGREQKGKKYKI